MQTVTSFVQLRLLDAEKFRPFLESDLLNQLADMSNLR